MSPLPQLSRFRVEFTWASDAGFTVAAQSAREAIVNAQRQFEEDGFDAVEDEHIHFTEFSAERIGASR